MSKNKFLYSVALCSLVALANQDHDDVRLYNTRAVVWLAPINLTVPLELQPGLEKFDIFSLRAGRDGIFPSVSLTNAYAELALRPVWNRITKRGSLAYTLYATDPTGKKLVFHTPSSRLDFEAAKNVAGLAYEPLTNVGDSFTIPGIHFPFRSINSHTLAVTHYNISSDVTVELTATETENLKNSAASAYCLHNGKYDYQLDELTVNLGGIDYACRARKPKKQHYHLRLDYFKNTYKVSFKSLNEELNQQLADPTAPYASFAPTFESRVRRIVTDQACLGEGDYYYAECFIDNKYKRVSSALLLYINQHAPKSVAAKAALKENTNSIVDPDTDTDIDENTDLEDGTRFSHVSPYDT